MKKINLLLILILFLILAGCNVAERTVGTLSDFEKVAGDNSYTVYDNINHYSGANYITGAMVANKENVEIEMIAYNTEENAGKVQEEQINSFMNLRNVSVTVKKEKGKNYYKFTMISNGYYMVSSRIDNTLIFTKAKVDDKDSIDNILSEMGY